jgi:ligand-binding sensor domain-containing protein/signal transduction histidine kinase
MRVWTKDQSPGLPDNVITAILQTTEGYLWIGTPRGLARFDGVRFVTVTPPGDTQSASLSVTTLYEDGTGRLWVGTQGDGLLCYHNGELKSFTGAGTSLDRVVNSIAEDASGSLWLGTPSGLFCLQNQVFSRLTSREGLPNNFVSSVHIARSGAIWITTHGGMCQFKSGQINPFPFQIDSPSRNPESLGVYEDRRGNLWAFGDTYLVNLTEGKHLNQFGQGDTLSSSRIWSLCEGRHGELWIGTSGKGLYCFDQERFSPLTLLNGDLPGDVRSLTEDREGNLWLGTYGGGLVRLQARSARVLDATAGLPNRPVVCMTFTPQGRSWISLGQAGIFTGAGESFERFQNPSATGLQNLVTSLCAPPDGSLWVATAGAGLYRILKDTVVHYSTAQGLSDNTILAAAVDAQGSVWAGAASGDLHRFRAGELTRYSLEAGLRGHPITAITPARKGILWLGTDAGEIFRGENGVFRLMNDARTLDAKSVTALFEDAAGRVWAGTAAGRLGCLTAEQFRAWDVNTNASAPAVTGILSDEEGDVWLGTADTVYRLNTLDITTALTSQMMLHPRLVYGADSSPSFPPASGWPRALRAPDGKLWFGTSAGLVALNLRAPHGSSALPPVLIEEINVNGRPLPRPWLTTSGKHDSAVGQPTAMPSTLRSLDIRFTVLSFTNPRKARFRYRLDGFDAGWIDGGSDRIVHYGRLPYGTYTFHVQAAADNNIWQENEATFGFVVSTPLWLTPGALTLETLALVSVIGATARQVSNRRLRRRLALLAAQQAMERERIRIAQDMHDEIGSKLTKISFMSERAKGELQGQEPVARKLESIAATSRDLLQSLDEIVWAVNPRNDTLQHLADYFGQYATEYLQNTAVECDLRVPTGLPHHPLSAETRHNLFLAFEESLNNALKNGHATRIRISMEASPSRFELTVEDNGCGFDPDATSFPASPESSAAAPSRVGNGLRNMRQRLTEAGGACAITSRPGQGTTVRFTVPLGTGNGRNKHS